MRYSNLGLGKGSILRPKDLYYNMAAATVCKREGCERSGSLPWNEFKARVSPVLERLRKHAAKPSPALLLVCTSYSYFDKSAP